MKMKEKDEKLACLLVDDAPDNLYFLSRILERSGYDVCVASNGSEAILRAHEKDFAFIIMDMEMPVLDGYGATSQLRKEGFDRPIIALTSHTLAEEKKRILAAGCDAHLAKPVHFPLLFATIEQFLAKTP